MLPPALSYRQAAAEPTVLTATLLVVVLGAVIIAPSMAWLIAIQRRVLRDVGVRE
jgi:cytochrome d ubiquinol oxidase subunit II